MISAREGDHIFLKLSDNENSNDLQSLLEAYGINSGMIHGFGQIKAVETSEQILDGGDALLQGIISEFEGRPAVEIYCYMNGRASRIKNFVANSLILNLRVFGKIRILSKKGESGETMLSISGKEVHLPFSSERTGVGIKRPERRELEKEEEEEDMEGKPREEVRDSVMEEPSKGVKEEPREIIREDLGEEPKGETQEELRNNNQGSVMTGESQKMGSQEKADIDTPIDERLPKKLESASSTEFQKIPQESREIPKNKPEEPTKTGEEKEPQKEHKGPRDDVLGF
jgi:hypothetical protein